jgi:predicted PurR-regulated permease PerM
MKTKKFRLNLRNLAIAMTFCAILVFFTGNSAYAQQDASKNIANAATVNDLLAKLTVLENKLELMNQRMFIIETKLNEKFSNLDNKLDNKGTGLEANLLNILNRVENAINNLEKDMARLLKK